MAEKNQRDFEEHKYPTYPVMLVQAPYSLNEEQGVISLMDIFTWLKMKWKWFFLVFVLSFLVATVVLNKKNQQVSFQQFISVPTAVSALKMNEQRTSVFLPLVLIQSFNASYLLNWKTQKRLYVNKDFSLVSQLSPSTGADEHANDLPDGMLLLNAQAPIQAAPAIGKLFDDSLKAIQTIVSAKIDDLKKVALEKIKSDQANVLGIQATLQVLKAANEHSSSASVNLDQSINVASLQQQLIIAKNTLLTDQLTLSSLQPEVKFAGAPVIGQPDSILLVLSKAFAISVALAFMMALLAAFFSLSVVAQNTHRK